MDKRKMNRAGRGNMDMRSTRTLVAIFCASAFLFVSSSAVAAEEETLTFNAKLSLTGDCTTSATIDPVPDPSCPDEPTSAFIKQGGVAVDRFGNRYVASVGPSITSTKGRVDIFDSSGEFITKIENVAANDYEISVAVDSDGNLYVARELSQRAEKLARYEPTKYNPAAGEIEYGKPPVFIPSPEEPPYETEWYTPYMPILIDPANDHLYVKDEFKIYELSSAAEGNTHVRTIILKTNGGEFSNSFAIDSARNRLYVTELKEDPKFGVPTVVKAYDLAAPGSVLFTIDGTTTPTNRFVSESRVLPLAVNEETGNIFVGDLGAPTPVVYEFDSAGNPVSTFGGGLLQAVGVGLLQMAYDNSPTSPTQHYLFVPSDKSPGRSLAFGPKPPEAPPEVEDVSTSSVTTREAILRATINPKGLATTYHFEYLTDEAYEANGGDFEGATSTAEGNLSPAGEGLAVSAPVSGLQPGVAYRFRVVAENALGDDEGEAAFATFGPVEASTDCPNQHLRIGASALLPDCRAYELVTPPNTNGQPPLGGAGLGSPFINRVVSPAGDKVPFRIDGGALAGYDATGSFQTDPYVATRTPEGWTTSYVGPSPAFAPEPAPGTGSPDKGYFFWTASGSMGPALLNGGATVYLRYPDGHSELLGQGSIGQDPRPEGRLISEGGSHVIFEGDVQLEPTAAPTATRSIYDRTADGILHVVALKPGEEPFGAGAPAEFRGASLDGAGVVFVAAGTLYLRYDNAETFEIDSGATFAGIVEGGKRVFYRKGGELFRFDASAPPGERITRFSDGGLVEPVGISEDGTAAYFLTETAIGGSGPNPRGAEPEAGKRNLYLSRGGQVDFVATVTDRDAQGENHDGLMVDGLDNWLSAVLDSPAKVPARISADGSVLLFKSRAVLTGQETGGFAQIYRYDSDSDEIRCMSCNPTGAAPTSDATLQTYKEIEPVNSAQTGIRWFDWIQNLRADGRRAFFETKEGLVGRDVDGRRDVYEWEDQGVGDCQKTDGCLNMISFGESGSDEFLYGVSESGDDVFILSSDLLAGGDNDETRSIYDARVGGGFPPPPVPAGECLGEACQPAAVAPKDLTPASAVFEGAGNVQPEPKAGKKHCPKGKRAVRRSGKVRCVRRHKKRHREHGGAQAKRHGNGNGRAGR